MGEDQTRALPEIRADERGFLRAEEMRLDPRNPRLASRGQPEELDELEAIRQLLDHADLRELVETIAANGFINFEPLIVLRKPDHYLVVEGNRRLGAVKLLQKPSWAEELGVGLPPMADRDRKTLDRIEVQVVESREAARQFIGFKHINGPHKWDSLAKGKFAADWYRSEEGSGLTLRDVARRLGDRHDTIKRLVQGIYVLEQAEKEGLFDTDDRHGSRPFAFSHLYTALTRPSFRRFLGLPEKWRDSEPEPDPVPEERKENLRKVLVWLYGSKEDEKPPVVTSQNPHVKQLGEVLDHRVAMHRLESSSNLREAFSEVETPARKFTEAMIKALQAAEKAQQNVYDFDAEDASLLEIARRLHKIAHSILRQLEEEQAGGSGAS